MSAWWWPHSSLSSDSCSTKRQVYHGNKGYTLPGVGHLRSCFPGVMRRKSLNNFFLNFNALRHMGSLVPGQGLNQHFPSEAQSLNHWMAQGCPNNYFCLVYILKNNFISNLLMKQSGQTRSLKKALADKAYCSQYRQACIFKKRMQRLLSYLS